MKNPVVPAGEEPSHCKVCGAELVIAPAPNGGGCDPKTGLANWTHRMCCPSKQQWWRSHASYIVTRTGMWLDEERL